MPCQCEERKAELAKRGVKPLVGKEYTPIDFAQWAIIKAFEKVTTLRS